MARGLHNGPQKKAVKECMKFTLRSGKFALPLPIDQEDLQESHGP